MLYIGWIVVTVGESLTLSIKSVDLSIVRRVEGFYREVPDCCLVNLVHLNFT